VLVKRMDDDELLAALAALARDKHRNDAVMLAHIGEVERRRLFAREGRPSMFEYCVKVLRLSESAASKRIRVARLARRFPVILDLVEAGELHLSGLCVLGAHLNDNNHRTLLDRARGMTKRQIEALAAELSPRPDVPASVKKVAGVRATPTGAQASLLEAGRVAAVSVEAAGPMRGSRAAAEGQVSAGAQGLRGAAARQDPAGAPAAAVLAGVLAPCEQAPGPVDRKLESRPTSTRRATDGRATARRPGTVEVLAPERYLIKVTVGAQVKAKLERARALVSHSVPNGDLEQVLERALDALIENTEKRRFGKGRKPRRQSRPLSEGTRTIPAAVARQVVALDGEQCSYSAADGHVCGSSWLLQMHHLKAFARGGPPTADNVAVFCAAHNQYAADVEFGREFMERRRRRRAARTDSRRGGTAHAKEAGAIWN
jgi:hypothetical protein